jgi:cell division protein FtsI (penicillin-binding protein 3)
MKISQAKWTRLRIIMVLGVFVLAWAGILFRAFDLQVLEREKLARVAAAECRRTVRLSPTRGEIFDRNGEKLAVSLEADSIFAQPSKIKDSARLAEKLAGVLGLNKAALVRKLKKRSSFTWIRRQVSPEISDKVRTLDIEGVGFVKESKRYYPNTFLASHTLGFVGVDSSGLEGLELGYDEYLRGEEETWHLKRDALGRTYLDRADQGPEVTKGANITLTLDRRIQYVTEKALARAVEDCKAKGGMALVVRPQTGEILALAVAPSFNPNIFGKYKPERRRNRVLTDTFDPGSTFKIFVVAAALEEGLFTPQDRVFCEKGEYKVSNHIIHDHKAYEWLTVDKVIKYSSNIGTVKISEKLGRNNMYEYLKRFNFGEPTEVDFPGESSGVLRDAKKWRKLDTANVAFGQGVTVTALQMTMAMAALANDGLLMRPYLVSRITGERNRDIKHNKPLAVRQVISPQTAREINAMLRQVVTEGGTGTAAEPMGYPAAGKTGTAQKLDRSTGRYSKEKYFSSFLGFAPYDDPELVIFVGIDEPSTQTYGGQVAAPVFREIAEETLPMLNVPPRFPEEEQPELLKTAKPKALKVEKASTKAVSNRISRKISLASAKTDHSPAAPQAEDQIMAAKLEALRESIREEAAAAGEYQMEMPDLVGLSMRRVLDKLSGHDIDLKFIGSGLAVWQKPAPGEPLNPGQKCLVRFEHN